MKKLMITLSAAVLAFGAFADGVTFPVGENFNASTDIPATITGAAGTETAVSTTAYAFSQETAAGLPDQHADEAAGNNLAIKTAFNSPIAYAPFAAAQALDATHLYFDSLVKFTACDEAPDAAMFAAGGAYEGAKLVVWIKEIEEGNTVTKRLMVTAGKLDSELAPTRQDYDCGDPADYGIASDTDWCRLTIKAVKDITPGSQVTGFVIFVNAKAVEISSPTNIGIAASALTGPMSVWKNSDHLFPSLIAQDATITSVGFAGQGAIDDLSFTKTEPTDASSAQFALDQDPPIATVNGTSVTSVSALNAVLASSAGAVVLLADVTGDLAFQAAGANTLDLGAYTLNGGVTASGGSSCTLTISGTTGKIEGVVLTDDDEVINFVSGKIKVDTNPDINDNVTIASGYELKAVEGYYTVAEIQEDGSQAKPWKINTAADFTNKLVANATKGHYFVQTADITLTGTFPGIGAAEVYVAAASANKSMKDALDQPEYKANAFNGHYDGGNFTVKGLVLQAGGDYIGFFNSCYQATIKNLKVAIGGVKGWSDGTTANSVGAVIVGVAVETTLENCSTVVDGSNDTFEATKTAAGLVCYANVGTVLKSCANNLKIVSKANAKAAGLIACAQATGASEQGYVGDGVVVEACTNSADITTQAATSQMGGLVGYTDTKVTFKGANVCAGALVASAGPQSVIYLNGGSVVLAEGATITVPAAYKTINKNAVDGLYFATVADGVATLVKNSAAVAGANLKVMADGAPGIVLANVGDTITVDKTLVPSFSITTTAANAYLAQSGNTYTVTAKTAPAITITGVSDVAVEYTAGMTLPTPSVTVAGDLPYTGAWDPTAITEPAAGATNTYTYTVNVAATSTTLANTATATYKVFKKAGGSYPPFIPGGNEDAKTKYDTWAKDQGVTDPAAAKQDAFLLNCANTDDAIAAAKANFKVTSITQDADGNWVVKVTGDKGDAEAYGNGYVNIEEVTITGAGANSKFYKATLTLSPKNPE